MNLNMSIDILDIRRSDKLVSFHLARRANLLSQQILPFSRVYDVNMNTSQNELAFSEISKIDFIIKFIDANEDMFNVKYNV